MTKPILEFRLTLPGRILSPNGRAHWTDLHKARKAQRTEAGYACLAAMRDAKVTTLAKAELEYTFTFATQRERDADNLIASMKAAQDGFADAKLVPNDSAFFIHSPMIVVKKNRHDLAGVVVRVYEVKK